MVLTRPGVVRAASRPPRRPPDQAALSYNRLAATSSRRCPFSTAWSKSASWRSMSLAHNPGRRSPRGPRDRRVASGIGDDVTVRRVVVYGSSGSGKSVFASQLAALGLEPHVEIDVLAYDDGIHVEQAELQQRFGSFITGDTWVVEGMHRDQLEVAIPRADVFVWIDIPRRIVTYRLVTRTLRHALRRHPRHGRRVSLHSLVRRELPFIIKSVRSVPRRQEHARRLADLARASDVEVVQLSSSRTVRAWVQELRSHLRVGPHRSDAS